MLRFIAISLCTVFIAFTMNAMNITLPADELLVKKTNDFEISGDGSAKNWENTQWIAIPQRSSAGADYQTKAKLLYSSTGIYCLFSCEDKILTNTMQADFLDLWNEDVIEFFLQPDAKQPTYLEYELSPLNYELPILVFNQKGNFNSWLPFHYEGQRKTKHATTIIGGEKKSKATVSGWTVEAFIPFKLLSPLMKNLPASGATWKGNLYRIDYDKGEALWSWQLTSGNFHEYEKFGTIRFE
jgi:hypothetical protein